MRAETDTPIAIHPLDAERWADLEDLFGPRGAQRGCWCMWWRARPREYKANVGDGNRRMFRGIVEEGAPQGLLAYSEGKAIGWCSVSTREEYARLATSATWKPVDNEIEGVWAIVCYFIHSEYRGQRIADSLLTAAVDYARSNGARIIEGYPKDVTGKQNDRAIYFGTLNMYLRHGFVETARRNSAFPIVRLHL